MRKRKVGDVIPVGHRNSGWSYGLEFPYLWSSIGMQAIVWNRGTGKVRFVAEREPDERDMYFAERRANARCERMNALSAGYANGILPVDIGAIDSTP